MPNNEGNTIQPTVNQNQGDHTHNLRNGIIWMSITAHKKMYQIVIKIVAQKLIDLQLQVNYTGHLFKELECSNQVSYVIKNSIKHL